MQVQFSNVYSEFINSFNPSMTDFDYIERIIAIKINDPEKAAAIRQVYEKEFKNLGTSSQLLTSNIFTDWLIEMSKILGATSINHMELADKSFPENLLFEIKINKDARMALTLFFEELVNKWGRKLENEMKLRNIILEISKSFNLQNASNFNSVKTIAVLFRRCGNGHVTASEGIKQFLESRGYKVELINGGDFETLIQKQPYPCTTQLQELRTRMKLLNPDLIINTVAHHHKWTQVAYDLNVPALVIHTDYTVEKAIVEDDGAIKTPYYFENSSLVQYCIPHEDPDANRFTINIGTSSKRYQTIVNELGFPVRQSFERELNPEKIQQIRQEFGFKDDERVILLLGHREPDTTKMITIIQKLFETNRLFAHPICMVAVCGKEVANQTKVKNAVKSMPYHPDMRIQFEEYLDETKMANYMKIISRTTLCPGIMISKTGGSTTAEIAKMGVYVICLQTVDKEQCNANYLHRHHLGEIYNESDFVSQVGNALKWNGDRNHVYQSPFDWKTNLETLVKQKLTISALSKVGKYDFAKENTA